MNILLIHPRLMLNEITPDPRFPLGLGYIAAALQNAGHRVDVVDLNAQNESENELKKKIEISSYNMIGIRAMITQFKQVQELASLIKSVSQTKIVLGGGLASSVPEMVLKEADIDIAVVGEGETTVVELAARIENQQSIVDLKGIACWANGKVVKAPPQSYIDDISTIPFPAWDLFPMERYFNKADLGFPKRKISVITSRGCPYQCSFCFHGIFGYKYRSRSAENVVKEVELLSNKYGVHGIMFEDDTFTVDRHRVYEICDLLIKKAPKIIWTCNGRVNLINKDMLNKMRSAGCASISYGIESGSQKILNNINKGVEVSKMHEAIKLTWESGIVPHAFLMLGTPGETVETVRESIDFCKKAGIAAEFTIATPIPGTRLYQEAVNMGRTDSLEGLVRDWGNWYEEILVNVTDISTHELQNLKKQAEKEVFISFIRNRKKYFVNMFFREIRVNGVKSLLTRIFKGIRLLLRIRSGRGLSGVKN